MKNKMISISILFVFLFFTQVVYADSPVTSTPFSEAYLDVSLIRKARSQGVFTEEMCGFLTNLDIFIDQKAALINALGWAYEGKNEAEMFSRYLFHAHRFQTKSLPLYALNGSELMCLVYLSFSMITFTLRMPGKSLKKL